MKLLQAFWKLFKRTPKTKTTKGSIQDKPAETKKPESGTIDQQVTEKKKRGEAPSPVMRPKREELHFQVGLDFGTSSTKIIYKLLGTPEFRVVNFKHNLPNYPNYCLPSLAAKDRHGNLQLGVEAAKELLNKNWDSGFQRFKVIVAGKYDQKFKDDISENNFYEYRDSHGYDDKFTPERLTAIYLAFVMKKAREIIENFFGDHDALINLAFNICMPIDHVENNKVKIAFEEIFGWAERIETAWRSTPIGFDPMAASYELEGTPLTITRRVFAVPEAVAEITSYMISLRKRKGLHAIIDLGAGTTDLSICNLFIFDQETECDWYAARNIPRGTTGIERIIAKYINDCGEKSLCTHSDVLSYLPNLGKKNNALNRAVRQEIKNLKNSTDYSQTWGSAYWNKLRNNRSWNHVEIFLTGGGSGLPYLKEIFSEPWLDDLKNEGIRYTVSNLPSPDNYDTCGIKIPFERMSVAYGLAWTLPEIPEFKLPADSPDDTPPKPRVIDLDRDELYPK
jgi:hypothetical protein